MAVSKWLLPILRVLLVLLMVDAIIELSLISSMVAWLHRFAGGDLEITNSSISNLTQPTFLLHGKPRDLIVNHGHLANAAAGTSFTGIGLGGVLVLWLRERAGQKGSHYGGCSQSLYCLWTICSVLSCILTLSGMIFTLSVIYQHDGQTIDEVLASSLHDLPYPHQNAYTLQKWTPENWFSAVLQLHLSMNDDRINIATHLRIMKAWKWNLVPLFILGLCLAVVAIIDAVRQRKEALAVARVSNINV